MRVLSAPPSTGRAGTAPDGDPRRSRARGRGGDRGQVAVEFLGMLPLIAAVCVLLWQSALLGYTYIRAGNAADEGARQGAADAYGQSSDQRCRSAAREDLGSWSGDIACGPASGGMYAADVTLKVPVLFPGFVDFPFAVEGHASAVDEGAAP
ncbi:pilus assembly protein [Streptomyces sp. PKU-EA00015]|uniref:TadE family protein n=1 Tax=Streptomyces sp. PKU-EA00015 TaxID=2748326 RepID=UPI0015A058A6|nr:TadE family protein [Streptomyces sp. PKU-EA00015]NWF29695.1 pilus assembly protein [Streptomyces sp. PKU-EA00015]